jgi:hypothetical protein
MFLRDFPVRAGSPRGRDGLAEGQAMKILCRGTREAATPGLCVPLCHQAKSRSFPPSGWLRGRAGLVHLPAPSPRRRDGPRW